MAIQSSLIVFNMERNVIAWSNIVIKVWVRARLCKLQKMVHSDSQVIKFTSCLPMVGGSLRVLRLLPPLKLVAMI
jgi:hypothetical protein